MKKIIVATIAAVAMLFAGCDLDENVLTQTANTAGNLAMLTWFSVDDPDPQVKEVLKEVVSNVTTTSVQVAEGKTYFETLLPVTMAIAEKQTKLNDYQKTLINAGSIVILNGIDTFLATNEKFKTNAELVNKVVAAFGKGCLNVLNMSDKEIEIQRARSGYKARSIKCRGGKFVDATVKAVAPAPKTPETKATEAKK